jgi:cytochrome c peroxidase
MQFWDGRTKDLFEQAAHPILNPQEMGGEWKTIIEHLRSDSDMVTLFSIYPQGITATNIQDAIALFERTLITPDSPFDLYLQGDQDALSKVQKEGYKLFKSLGCISCHQGRNVGGTLFQRIGVYATETQLSQLQEQDQGRFEITGNKQDRLIFKVPSLRNITRTAPYFHNGSRTTLEDAVSDMGRLQLGQELSKQQIEKLIQFLESLTGIYSGSAS